MTEQKAPYTTIALLNLLLKRLHKLDTERRHDKNINTILSVIMIILVIALGSSSYYNACQESRRFLSANQALQKNLDRLNQNQKHTHNLLKHLSRKKSHVFGATDREKLKLRRQVKILKNKISTISRSDNRA
ncbi:hypothetical protein [Candidatus Gillettellia adelgis]